MRSNVPYFLKSYLVVEATVTKSIHTTWAKTEIFRSLSSAVVQNAKIYITVLFMYKNFKNKYVILDISLNKF